MLFTVGNYAANYYKTYSFDSSDKNAKNSVDASKISKERYNVSNLTNALDVLGNSISDNFSVVTSVDLYSKNMYKMSQVSSFNDLSEDLNNTSLSDFLKGSANSSGMYKVMGQLNESNVGFVKSIFKKIDVGSNIINKYKNYFSETKTGDIFDILT